MVIIIIIVIIIISSSINHYHFALSATTKAENKSIANYYLKEGMHAMIDLYNIAVLELQVVFSKHLTVCGQKFVWKMLFMIYIKVSRCPSGCCHQLPVSSYLVIIDTG